jgi:flavin reductase (DIM6/NTAB) family NADH-FMN oxidoreductase RutF
MSERIDPRQYRQMIGLFATGVTVIAAKHGDEIRAMTANAVTSLSLDPLLLLVCVGKKAQMAEHLIPEMGFSVNILREDQQVLSTYFAGSWQEPAPPPFRFVPWQGKPRLEGCLASLGCEVYERIEGGDHWIVVGRVTALHRGIEPHLPLLFYAGRYAQLSVAEREPAPDLDAVEVAMQIFYDPWHYESE